jgi:hypothetical protein
MATELRFFFANRNNQRPIHSQRFDRCSACRSQSDNAETFPAEMVGPDSAPWMVERDFLSALWVYCTLPGSLPQRTGDTGQRQVIYPGHSAGNHGDYMIDMEGRFLPFLRQSTVFTSPSRPFYNGVSQGSGNMSHTGQILPLRGFISASGGITPCPLGAQSQKSQKLGQIDQTFGLVPLRRSEFFAAILSIEEILQALINPSWQGETVDIIRHFELKNDMLGHIFLVGASGPGKASPEIYSTLIPSPRPINHTGTDGHSPALLRALPVAGLPLETWLYFIIVILRIAR